MTGVKVPPEILLWARWLDNDYDPQPSGPPFVVVVARWILELADKAQEAQP